MRYILPAMNVQDLDLPQLRESVHNTDTYVQLSNA